MYQYLAIELCDVLDLLDDLIENALDILSFRVLEVISSVLEVLWEPIHADITSAVDNMGNSNLAKYFFIGSYLLTANIEEVFKNFGTDF
jgi:hypothetical protein